MTVAVVVATVAVVVATVVAVVIAEIPSPIWVVVFHS